MNAYELAEDIEFIAAHYISIIGDLYMMDVASMIRKQAQEIEQIKERLIKLQEIRLECEVEVERLQHQNHNQKDRINELEKQIYGSR